MSPYCGCIWTAGLTVLLNVGIAVILQNEGSMLRSCDEYLN